jgi:hypothetical protein
LKLIDRTELGKLQKDLVNAEFKGTLLSSEEHTAYLNGLVFPDSFFTRAEEIVSVFNLCIYMHKKSCLIHAIDDHIIALTSSGLMNAWTRAIVDKSYLIPKTSTQPKKLNNEMLHGAYQLWILGLIASFFVFLLEILKKKLNFLKKI